MKTFILYQEILGQKEVGRIGDTLTSQGPEHLLFLGPIKAPADRDSQLVPIRGILP